MKLHNSVIICISDPAGKYRTSPVGFDVAKFVAAHNWPVERFLNFISSKPFSLTKYTTFGYF